jgi:hypothetical protein
VMDRKGGGPSPPPPFHRPIPPWIVAGLEGKFVLVFLKPQLEGI